jgi:hypothetical protein
MGAGENSRESAALTHSPPQVIDLPEYCLPNKTMSGSACGSPRMPSTVRMVPPRAADFSQKE